MPNVSERGLGSINRFRRLPRAEQSALLWAFILIPLVGMSLRLGGYRRTVAWIEGFAPSSTTRKSGALSPQAVDRLVDVAVRRIPLIAPSCLPRSLILRHLLRREGYLATLHFGARKTEGRLLAHAWIELDGVVIGDAPDVARTFVPFEGPFLGPSGVE